MSKLVRTEAYKLYLTARSENLCKTFPSCKVLNMYSTYVFIQ